MRKYALEFVRRGLVGAGFGPVVLAIIYLILHSAADLDALTVGQVCTGIFSLTALAFVAGGMNFIYQVERLPLMMAVLVHGAVLYLGYLITYLLNGWLEWGVVPFLVFTAIFVVGYFVIWAAIYAAIRNRIKKVNEMLSQKCADEEDTPSV